MDDSKAQFAQRLRDAMQAAGYAPRPAVLEREFNTRYWGKPMTLHGVRRWLLGETLPSQPKLMVLAEWLKVPPHELRFGADVPTRIEQRRKQWDRAVGFEEREIFEAFLRLPVPQRRVVREVIVAFDRAYGVLGVISKRYRSRNRTVLAAALGASHILSPIRHTMFGRTQLFD